jgi:hypothetical protein
LIALSAVLVLLLGAKGCAPTGDLPPPPQEFFEGEGDQLRREDEEDEDEGDGSRRRPGESLQTCKEREFDWNC